MIDNFITKYFSGKGVVVIEWAERAKNLLQREHLVIKLSIISKNERKICLRAKGEDFKKRIKLCK